MQSGERQFHLRLHTSGTRQMAPRRLHAQITEQRCLAHTRFTGNHQRPALTSANSLEQPVEHAALGVAVNQLHRAPVPVKSAVLHGAALTIPGDGAGLRRDAASRRRTVQNRCSVRFSTASRSMS
jgi:hypothetical protein